MHASPCRSLVFAVAVAVAFALAGACGLDEGSSKATVATTTTEPGGCSAADHPPLEAQPGLPEPVAATRQQIAAAAIACDFDALAGIDDPHVSFGSGGNTAAYWRLEEGSGREPMRALVELLDSTHATVEGRYVWPAAFARLSWDQVTPSERDELRRLYDDEDLADFSQFGSYIGWRVGIGSDGTWSFFIAGD